MYYNIVIGSTGYKHLTGARIPNRLPQAGEDFGGIVQACLVEALTNILSAWSAEMSSTDNCRSYVKCRSNDLGAWDMAGELMNDEGET